MRVWNALCICAEHKKNMQKNKESSEQLTHLIDFAQLGELNVDELHSLASRLVEHPLERKATALQRTPLEQLF